MVAETAHVVLSAIGPVGNLPVGTKQEGETAFAGPALHHILHPGTHQDMVQVPPYTPVAVRTPHTTQPDPVLLDDTGKAAACHREYRIARLGVEIAQNDDFRLTDTVDGIDQFQYRIYCQLAILARCRIIVATAGEMDGNDMKRISRRQDSGCI